LLLWRCDFSLVFWVVTPCSCTVEGIHWEDHEL